MLELLQYREEINAVLFKLLRQQLKYIKIKT